MFHSKFKFNFFKYKVIPINFDEIIEEPHICCICLTEIKNKKSIFLENCNHEYHVDCLTEWFKIKQTCPSCRSNQMNACILLNNYQIRKRKRHVVFKIIDGFYDYFFKN